MRRRLEDAAERDYADEEADGTQAKRRRKKLAPPGVPPATSAPTASASASQVPQVTRTTLPCDEKPADVLESTDPTTAATSSCSVPASTASTSGEPTNMTSGSASESVVATVPTDVLPDTESQTGGCPSDGDAIAPRQRKRRSVFQTATEREMHRMKMQREKDTVLSERVAEETSSLLEKLKTDDGFRTTAVSRLQTVSSRIASRLGPQLLFEMTSVDVDVWSESMEEKQLANRCKAVVDRLQEYSVIMEPLQRLLRAFANTTPTSGDPDELLLAYKSMLEQVPRDTFSPPDVIITGILECSCEQSLQNADFKRAAQILSLRGESLLDINIAALPEEIRGHVALRLVKKATHVLLMGDSAAELSSFLLSCTAFQILGDNWLKLHAALQQLVDYVAAGGSLDASEMERAQANMAFLAGSDNPMSFYMGAPLAAKLLSDGASIYVNDTLNAGLEQSLRQLNGDMKSIRPTIN